MLHSLKPTKLYQFVVVPHITDAIQEWVESESRKPVTEDNLEPEVLYIKITTDGFFTEI